MEGPVLHVLVVGFHHKKGCQVEYSYPPLIEGNSVDSHELPEEWKHLPSLALPDGAHNFTKDTVYFVLPGRKDNPSTVYGVSCYRQMDAKDLINRTADVTRSTVQKSVCVLSRLPLFGLIKAKLELITHAYFDERDFSQVTLLEQTLNNLNSSLTQSLLEGTQVFLGLPVRELVALYKHKIIILFKLLLLERRVLFFGSPVESLCQTVLGVLSLFPGMLESGLMQACNQLNEKKLSPTLGVASFNSDLDEDEQFLEVRYHSSSQNSPLSEVLCHMHNSDLSHETGSDNYNDYTSVNINYEETAKSCINTKEPPESPSIPRDELVTFAPESNGNGPWSECPEIGNKEQLTNIPNDKSLHYQKTRTESSNADESDKLTVHSVPRNKKLSLLDTKAYNYVEDKNHSCENSSPDHADKIFFQSEKTSDDLDLDAKLQEGTAVGSSYINHHGSLILHTTIHRLNSDEIIEDLDSPESISKIDKEDCFSWEQDHLQLSIDHEHDDTEVIDLVSSTSASRDSEAISDKESVSSDSTAASSTQPEKYKHKTLVMTSAKNESPPNSPHSKETRSKLFKNKLSAALSKVGHKSKLADHKDEVTLKQKEDTCLQQDNFGYPLVIFTQGAVCHPYLSLQYHDILTDVNTRSFVIGATNVLFKQRRQLIDVLVEVGDGKLDIRDKELQRHLSLTTADLRFADYLVKIVTEEKIAYLDGTEWEGSDEWVRAQFKHYLNSLFATVIADDTRALDDFGSAFMSAWKTTHNFRYWQEREHSAVTENPSGHPFQGNLSMADVRVRFNHTLQNSERGRKINAAVVQTGKYVVQTGKVVGGAISSARSAVSGWFSSWRHTDKSPEETQEPIEEIIENTAAN
ncbi:unnamed protein product [Candidula unifasciata]|uniref:UDENN domain-containing protein n=1 Tax=Candidula unifasciata TaxID=100452 RepID=A0A8S4A6I9_9EUPU|nr:unnamed protein product [Candidula unifasciata]